MSLYNMLFGVNGNADVLLGILGLTRDNVPRFRDCYFDEEGNIAIHTRTGGGNREFYESEESRRSNYPGDPTYAGPWNEDLRRGPTFLRDEDDDFDSTYANFYYSVPDEFAKIVEPLMSDGQRNPAQAWQSLFSALKDRNTEDPTVKNALKVGEQILKPILEAISKREA